MPESAREFLDETPAGSAGAGEDARSFHYQSAPIYLLTAAVGLLLGADLLLGVIGDPAWTAYRTPFGLRLALLAAVLGGARILYQTLEALFDGKVGADLALTIAALAAIVLGEHVTAALVVFVALCGESLEGYTLDRARQAIGRIFNLCPPTAHVQRDGREIDLPIDQVVPGDTILVRPGERVPADGRVTAGTSAVDQSALTGESLPIDKGPGDEVFTGTLNQYGSLTVAAEKVGGETTLGQVIRLVAEATERKTPLERTADRLARMFLPFVLIAAGMTLVGWRVSAGEWAAGFRPMLSVLVVACPCPLILATPTAVMAAMAWLARTGVVVKGSVALERLAQVDTFAFDKTGTLTRGELALADVFALPPLNETELLRTAAIAERRSEHLLARLIVREAESRGCVVPAIDDFTAHPGAGVVAQVRATMLGPEVRGQRSEVRGQESGVRRQETEGRRQEAGDRGQEAEASGGRQPLGDSEYRTVTVGSRRLMDEQGVALPAEIEQRLAGFDEAGQTVLLVAVDGEVLGVIGVRDTVRAESREVLAQLKNEGIEQFALLTGDRPQPARAVAKSLGYIDQVEAGLLPLDKARWIDEQTRQGRRVAMVGDGVNDAPALASSTVGLALGGVGSDLAAEAGDLVLMGDPLRPLPGLLRLSRQLVRNIRQSIFLFAFGMNGAGMVLAAWGILSPVAAAVFHEVASLAVMLNAMRLLWFERWDETRLGRFSEQLTQAAEWLTVTLSPTRAVFRFLDHWTVLARLALAALALYWLTLGLVLLAEDEQALVSRFGRHETTLAAGLHWRWPPPLERIHRERVDQVRTVQIGFRSRPSAAADGRPVYAVEWTSDHDAGEYEPVPAESVVLTGEEVPVELTAEVHYRIADLFRYAYGSADPNETVRAAAESAIHEVAARASLNGLLTDRREAIERQCLDLVRRRLAGYRLGIKVSDLTLLEVHPPREVVPAYRDVADAMEEQEQRINEAQAYSASKLLSAAGERAVRLIENRPPPSPGWPDRSKLDDDLWRTLTEEDETGESPLSGEAAATLLSARQERTTQVEAAGGSAARFNSLLDVYQTDRSLTGSQLYWQTIAEALSSRPLTIVDPAAAGRQHLLLVDPYEWGGLPQSLQTPLGPSGRPADDEEH